ncbi:hypothetical protein IEQ34_015562 [Dendrobium chrysotoxum]|uniref:Uncharacterized protein n=1 Tax=Dendrobium chrysotoxum TaxID=161865 RepID=A0AAV7GH15_DENCH|nr:hypothetical protein IEQ34_015562 [Dendrobium chrysotoxum]
MQASSLRASMGHLLEGGGEDGLIGRGGQGLGLGLGLGLGGGDALGQVGQEREGRMEERVRSERRRAVRR